MRIMLSVLFLAVTGTAFAVDQVIISEGKEVGVTGLGCKKDTYSIVYLEDRTGFTIGFTDYKLELTAEDQAKNVTKKDIACQITVPLHIPKQLRVTAVVAEYEGFASLPKMATLTFINNYRFFFVNAPPAVVTEAKVEGPSEKNFTIKDKLAVVSLVKSKCGLPASLIVKGRMQLENKNKAKAASVTVDAFNLTLEEKLKLKVFATYKWRSEACVPGQD